MTRRVERDDALEGVACLIQRLLALNRTRGCALGGIESESGRNPGDCAPAEGERARSPLALAQQHDSRKESLCRVAHLLAKL